MTAEVAIMNKWAIALAADSAVTTGSPGKEKIFNGANKLFTLSKHAPVGVMIYGHVEHFGIPWETLIKNYRRKLGRTHFSHITGYVEDFKNYICQSNILTQNEQVLGVLVACAHTSGSLISTILENDAPDRITAPHIKDALAKCELAMSGSKVLENYSDYKYLTFAREYADILDGYIKTNPFDLIHIPKSCSVPFKRLVHHYLISKMSTKYSTGIVIAGFGEEELFPTLCHFIVDGGVAGRVRIMDSETVDISRSEETVYVEAFAQEDAVDAFMNGVDESYEQYTCGIVKAFVMSHTQEILDVHTQLSDIEKTAIVSMVKTNLSQSVDHFRKALMTYSYENYRIPIEDVLRNAPKDEMAHVAESLVNLTSLKRRVSGDPLTVGGPVDVALISKGDGFIWIKRKHYFQPELNPHFARNYFDDGGSDGDK